MNYRPDFLLGMMVLVLLFSSGRGLARHTQHDRMDSDNAVEDQRAILERMRGANDGGAKDMDRLERLLYSGRVEDADDEDSDGDNNHDRIEMISDVSDHVTRDEILNRNSERNKFWTRLRRQRRQWSWRREIWRRRSSRRRRWSRRMSSRHIVTTPSPRTSRLNGESKVEPPTTPQPQQATKSIVPMSAVQTQPDSIQPSTRSTTEPTISSSVSDSTANEPATVIMYKAVMKAPVERVFAKAPNVHLRLHAKLAPPPQVHAVAAFSAQAAQPHVLVPLRTASTSNTSRRRRRRRRRRRSASWR
eukprot:scpid57904/ scgid7206/ 